MPAPVKASASQGASDLANLLVPEGADPVKHTVPYMLQVAARLQMADYWTHIAETGVYPAESYVLLELWRAEPLSQTELSRRLDIGNATVGQTLKRLERDGFVKRERLDADKRLVMARLTDKGRAVREPISRATDDLIAELGGVLGEQDAARLLSYLIRIVEHFRGSQSGRPGGGALAAVPAGAALD